MSRLGYDSAMKIAIDASRYSEKEATGVEWYSKNIIDELLKISGEDDVTTYSREPLNLRGNKVLKGKRFWTLQWLSREMCKAKPDVLFVPSHVLPPSLPKRSVIMIHDTAFMYLRNAYKWLQFKYLKWSTKFAVKNATKILVPSEATKNDLKKFFKCPEDKIVVIHHGFSKPETAAEYSDILEHFKIAEKKYILFVGRLESKKNLERLVEAFGRFAKTNDDYYLILAGKRGTGFERILKKVQHLNLMEKVIMPGYITESEKAYLYEHCEVFAFPSLYEGFGLPILEAFYYGKPVLTSHVSCLPEIAGDSAHFSDPYDPEMIADGLEKLINDKAYSERLVAKGKERLKEFSWKVSAEKTLRVLHGRE